MTDAERKRKIDEYAKKSPEELLKIKEFIKEIIYGFFFCLFFAGQIATFMFFILNLR